MTVVYFDQLFVDFSREITEKPLKWTKKVKKRLKKRFRPAFGCAQHPKAGRNTQHMTTKWLSYPSTRSSIRWSSLWKQTKKKGPKSFFYCADTLAASSGLSVLSTVLYWGVSRALQGSEMWILIGWELDSNFSVRATFKPNRQYLK